MFIIYRPDEFRQNIVNKITEIILQPPSSIQEPTDNSVIKLPKNVEKGVYNYAIKEATNRKIIKKWENKYFVQLYLDRLKTVFVNLKTTPLLVKKLVSGEI